MAKPIFETKIRIVGRDIDIHVSNIKTGQGTGRVFRLEKDENIEEDPTTIDWGQISELILQMQARIS